MLVNCEQVISLSARFGESFLEEFIERLQVFEPPVLSGSYLTEILTEFDEPLIALMLLCLLPGQNLIDLPENGQGPPMVEFGGHHGASVNPQVRPANQDYLLLDFGSGSRRLIRDDQGRVPDESN